MKYRVGIFTDIGDQFIDHATDYEELCRLEGLKVKFEVFTNYFDFGYHARRCDIIIIDTSSLRQFAGNLRDLANDLPNKIFYMTGGSSRRYISEEYGQYINECPNVMIEDMSLISHRIIQFYCEEAE